MISIRSVALISAIAFALAAPATSQTRRKKTRPTAPAPQPTVVTQADIYREQSRQIIEGATQPAVEPTPPAEQLPETTDQKLDNIGKRLDELGQRIRSMESASKNDYDAKQKRLLLNLDILTRAEERAQSLRKQLYEVIERESSVKTRLEQLEFDLRPEMIDRQVAFAGTLRPEELREMRRKNLDVERRNLQSLLVEIQSTRANLETNVARADQLVEKLRAKLEKDIDDALSDSPDN